MMASCMLPKLVTFSQDFLWRLRQSTGEVPGVTQTIGHCYSLSQHTKRFARLTAAHSKKLINHVHMVALYTTWYNFARINSSVRMSPAMYANLSDRLWDVGDIVNLIDAWETSEVVTAA